MKQKTNKPTIKINDIPELGIKGSEVLREAEELLQSQQDLSKLYSTSVKKLKRGVKKWKK